MLKLEEGKSYVDAQGVKYGPMDRVSAPLATTSYRRGNREGAVWKGQGSDGIPGERFFYADGQHVLEQPRDLVAMCGPGDLGRALASATEQERLQAQQAADIINAQSTGAPGKAFDDECRRLCPSILNGHANECPYNRGVR